MVGVKKRSREKKIVGVMAKKMVALLVAVVVGVSMSAGGAWADACHPDTLSVCLPSLVSGSKPTAECCTNLHAQQGCLCQYAKDPKYSKYISGPNAGNTLTSCAMAVPSCP
ncbi:hypothetical protein EJB05_23834, partial [Eragrostis curvula]